MPNATLKLQTELIENSKRRYRDAVYNVDSGLIADVVNEFQKHMAAITNHHMTYVEAWEKIRQD